MQLEIEGQSIDYKDLSDLRGKVVTLLAKVAQERDLHDQEIKRLRRLEKKLHAFLGDSPAQESSGHGSAKGAAHE